MIKILKIPKFENDSCIINISIDNIDNIYKKLSFRFNDEYIKQKDIMFAKKEICKKKNLIKFEKNKKSLKNIRKIKNLIGTIYTFSCELHNHKLYEDIIEDITNNLIVNKNTTRIILRNLPKFKEYLNSLNDRTIDVPCAIDFHYLNNKFIVNFRAHAIKSEFIADFFLIFKYFCYPVYSKINKNINYEIICNTTQEINFIKKEIKKLNEMLNGE